MTATWMKCDKAAQAGWRSFFRATLVASLIRLAAGSGFAAENAAPLSGLDPAIFTPDFFPILPWDPFHGWTQEFTERKQGLASIAACNFNIGGFVLPKDLPACEALGLKAIVAPDVPNLGEWMRDWKKLSDEEIDARIKKMVDSAGNSPAVLGYFLTDEPGASSYPALGKAVAAVKKYSPGKLAYINLFPSYATTLGAPVASQMETHSFTEYLERFVAEVRPQFISYDNYLVEYSLDMQNKERAAGYFIDLLEVRRVAQEHGLPFWNIVCSSQIQPQDPIPSPANMRLHAYTTLAAGGRGLTWYTYYSNGYHHAPIGPDEEKTLIWNDLQAANQEVKVLGPIMNRLASTGVYFSEPRLAPAMPALPGKLVDTVQSDLPVMVGEFTHEDGTAYVMLVNLSLERSARVTPLKGGKALEGVIISAQDGQARPIDYKYGLWLTAGRGVLLKLKSATQATSAQPPAE